jgi:hypothetical protein
MGGRSSISPGDMPLATRPFSLMEVLPNREWPPALALPGSLSRLSLRFGGGPLPVGSNDKSLSVVGERPLVRALGHTVAALEAVGAEHRVLNPQVRRAVGRVRGQAFFRLIFLLHTPVPLPQARRPDSCQTVWSSTTGWRLSDVRVAQTQISPRQPVILSSLLAVGGGVGLLLLERNDYTQKAASDRTTQRSSTRAAGLGRLALTLVLEV